MEILKLITAFEERNNLSIGLTLFGDGSGRIKGFWDQREIKEFESEDELRAYLVDTQYELAPSGRCYDPPREAKKGEK